MRKLLSITILVSISMTFSQCKKQDCGCMPPPEPHTGKLNYGDSIFYLKANDYSIAPLYGRIGTYTSFPNTLKIDAATGKITITPGGTDGSSQTGLWYKIKYTSANGAETDSTSILISGITYLDKFYSLAANDSIIYPYYNGSVSKPLPAGNYDLQHVNSFAIDPTTGQINIKESIRRGFFTNGSMMGWKTATVKYALSDASNGTPNNIDLVLYYYKTMAEVPSNVSSLMQAHQSMTLGFKTAPIPSTTGAIDNSLPSDLSLSKPRPPCVVVIGN